MAETKDQTTVAGFEMQDGASKGQLTAPAGGRLTRSQEIERGRAGMLADVEANKGEITRFLSAFGIDYEFFAAGLRIFLMRQVQNQPEFFTDVKPSSFMEALFRCAKDGLIPDGKEAAIGAFKGIATYMPMRDGFVKVLWRTGMIKDINDNVVTAPEDALGRFDYEEGDNGYIRHKPMLDRKDTDETMAAYCVIHLMTGGTIREVVMKEDLAKIARMSRSPARKDWKFQMDRKAAIRRAMGKMPREKNIAQVLFHDEANYDSALLDSRPETAITPKNLFGNRAAVKRKPMEIASAREDAKPESQADMAVQDGGDATRDQGDGSAADASGDEAVDEGALVLAITAIRNAVDAGALLEAETAALALATSDDERAWVEETKAARLAELMPPAETFDEGFVLTAVISSAVGPKTYEDPDLWRDDILNKLAVATGDALKKFWAVNLGHILDAGENGLEEHADRVLDIARGKGLPTEMPNG